MQFAYDKGSIMSTIQHIWIGVLRSMACAEHFVESQDTEASVFIECALYGPAAQMEHEVSARAETTPSRGNRRRPMLGGRQHHSHRWLARRRNCKMTSLRRMPVLLDRRAEQVPAQLVQIVFEAG